jgi:8-oxo-dGTP pyrophosphatase MutT (NUDIX family)
MMLRQPDQGLWWSSVTGMQETGETPEAAAARELREEAGLEGELRPLDFSHAFWVDPRLIGLPEGEPRFNTETCFQVEVPPTATVRLAPEEHSEFRWCSIPEARALMLWEGSKAALRLLERQLAG